MKKNEIKEKTIGELSRFTGISAHTIKYYEKIGLLSSNRNEHSNYRSYDVRICTDIYECVKYRNMDFSLKDTGRLLKEADDKMLEEMLLQRREELFRQKEDLQQKISIVDCYLSEIREIDERLGRWYIEEVPDFYLKKQTINLEYGNEEAQIGEGFRNSVEQLPQLKSVIALSKEYLNGGEMNFSWGNGMFVEKEHEKLREEGFLHIKKGRAFVTYMKFSGPYASSGQLAEAVRNVFAQYAKIFPADAYGVRMKITHDKQKNDWNYFKLFIPLE